MRVPTVFGEISQDCGRYRHFDLGSLDKDVWRAGGSSEMVMDAPVEGKVYLIRDALVEVCRARLAQAGRILDERYHTVADLTHYRDRFLQVASALPRAARLAPRSSTPMRRSARCSPAACARSTPCALPIDTGAGA